MHLATFNSNTTNLKLHANLCELNSYVIRENGNINKTHTYFDENFTQLKACRQNVDEVHYILFYTLLAIPDAEFNTYMKNLYKDWMDQVGEIKNIKFKLMLTCVPWEMGHQDQGSGRNYCSQA